MRKSIFTIAALVLMALATGCNNKNGGNSESVSDADEMLSYESVVVEDENEDKNVTFHFTVDFPTQGTKELTDVISRNIAVHMGGDSAVITRAGLDSIAEKFIKESSDDIAELSRDTDQKLDVSYSNEGKIKLVENTEKYVTYHYDSYLYMGGAHGMPSKGSFTIDKSCNEVLHFDDIFVEGKDEDIKTVIKKYLQNQYYQEEHEWNDMFSFELPSQEPALSTDGLIIYYAAYEIDCYAAGTPFCVIPYDEIDDLLTERVRNLIK